jgi:putative oxidoreductase
MATASASAPVTNPNTDLGLLLLRVVLGVLILLHGISKVKGGIGFIEQTVTQQGLPAAFAYGVYIGEVLAPLLLIAGLFGRLAAIVMAINMVVAVALVHMGDLGKMNENGGWQLELQGMYLVGALALALTGPGAYSVDGARRRA